VEPIFVSPDGAVQRALADRHLSRAPIATLVRDPRLRVRPGSQYFELDGKVVEEPVEIDVEQLRRGTVLVLAERVAVLMHEMTVPLPEPTPELGLVGVSAPLVEVQREVGRVRDVEVPVLLRGETGTGKELVARAIHSTGTRRDGPFVAVNMAALPPNLAAAELFGAVRGAFTGADRPRAGLFREASGGTLFLDEIGAMPSEVQVLLLRFLEDHEVRSIGAQKGEKIDVRVVAATDSDLDRAVAAGDFSQPLLQRFGGYEIRLPPLRERNDDLGLLLHHFLAGELGQLRKTELLSDPGAGKLPWLPVGLFQVLVDHSWPGNVRELRNVARRIAIRFHDSAVAVDEVASIMSTQVQSRNDDDRPPGRSSAQAVKARRSYRDPMEVSDQEIEEALRASRWHIKAAAAALGVSRPSLYKRIDAHPGLRKASDLTAPEIERAHRKHGGRLDAMVESLEVSRAALKARMRELGLPRA
jgi:two-component system nitrogen regulation response regulator GlnG